MYKRIIFYFLLCIFLYGCGQKEDVKKVNLSKKFKEQQYSSGDSIYVGIASILSPKEGFVYYEELVNYVGEKLGKSVILKQGRYREINELLRTGDIDFAFICSGPYVVANKEFGAELLVVPMVNGKASYYSYIISHRDSKINKIDDLKDKKFAFTNSLSTTGYIYPVYVLLKNGKQPKIFFSQYIFTHSHDNSVIAVAEKIVDGAAVHSLIYDYMKESKPDIVNKTNIISISPPFGIPGVVVPKNLNKGIKDKLEKIFLDLNQDEVGKKILAKLKIDKFTKSDDNIYNSIKKMKLEIEKFGY